MADFERRQLEIGLEFVRGSSAERNNLSEGYSESKTPSNSSARGELLVLLGRRKGLA